MTVLVGGAFDPPHVGHVALVEEAARRFAPEPLVVLVNAAPGHKQVASPARARLELARLAFPGREIELDTYARTIDLLEAGRYDNPVVVLGADEWARFFEIWVRPEDVLELARLAVATRPGYPRARLDAVLAPLRRPERVEFFELEPVAVSSSDVRERVARGEAIDGLVPPAVAEGIRRLGLYRSRGYTDGASSEETRTS